MFILLDPLGEFVMHNVRLLLMLFRDILLLVFPLPEKQRNNLKIIFSDIV